MMRREPETHRQTQREREREREMRRTWFFQRILFLAYLWAFFLRLGVLLIAFVCVVFQL